MNIASLPNKMVKLRELSSTNNTHLIRTSKFTDQELAIPGMSLFRSDIKTGIGNGVALYL